jgi:hypothetical protein
VVGRATTVKVAGDLHGDKRIFLISSS